MAYRSYRRWSRYVPVATRRRKAAQKIAQLERGGRKLRPVWIEGRKIASTFWGEAWCDNLEQYSDFANRLPRGRTYARNGSVIDLAVEAGRVTSLVSGSSIYEVEISVKECPAAVWKRLTSRCRGAIGSLVELLEGSLSQGVMDVMARPDTGLFPAPREISFSCSCPDWAWMCKHVAATLYGVGSRLDEEPELLFLLRGVDHLELLQNTVASTSLEALGDEAREEALVGADLAGVFDIEIDDEFEQPAARPPARPPGRARAASRRKTAAKGEPGRARKKGRAKKGKDTAKREMEKSAKKTGRRSSVASPRLDRVGRKTADARRRRTGRGVRSEPGKKNAAAPRRSASRRDSRTDSREPSNRPPVQIGDVVTSRDLVERGIPRTTYQNWVTTGVLVRTGKPGSYLATTRTEERIERALERRKGRRRAPKKPARVRRAK